MNDAQLFERQHRSLRSFYALLVAGAPDARLVEMDGVLCAVCPSVPDRSFPNGVVYDQPEQLAATLEDVSATYEHAGVRAWTVWVPELDQASARLLAAAGHQLDATPAAMAATLTELDLAPTREVAIEDDASIADVARINDTAYAYAGDFERLLRSRLPELYTYVARADGIALACAASYDTDGDCGISLVATMPAGRGLGLATDLMVRALADARERGCTTTSLQATKMGYPIYRRLGYRDLGVLQMWERRRPAAAAS